MFNKKGVLITAILLIAGAALAACAAPTPAATQAPEPTEAMTEEMAEAPTEEMTEAPTEASEDLLAAIQARGTLVISTDPKYPPQSELVEGVTRDPNTKCASDQQTAAQFKGFDIDVAVAIAEGLGVEPCFVTPDWGVITAGSWAGRWDISVGSVTITPERTEVLYFTQPYYTTPAAFFVAESSTLTQPSELSGMKVGACTSCTYDSYLAGTLKIPGETIDYVVKDVQFTGYDTDTTALTDLVNGRLDAVLTAQPTGEDWIAKGNPVKQLGDPVFFEYLAAAVDRSSDKDPTSLVAKVTEIIQGLHKDGTLSKLSETAYGIDLAAAAAAFDMSKIDQ